MSRFLNILVLTCVVFGIIQVPGLTPAPRSGGGEWPSLSSLAAQADRLAVPAVAGLAVAAGVTVAPPLLRRARSAPSGPSRQLWEMGSANNPVKSARLRTNAMVWVWDA
jgi:hypothetical protein